ncbi:MAG: methyltransferase domain-containing protein [Clostridia bacterium]|nr:methyltransferase domain-containing protein [Clostridia bacterium]
MRDVAYDAWAAYLCTLLPDGGQVADCACGTGEIALRLSKAGYAVTGIDISREMLAVAQEKAREAGRRIPFVCMDMRKLQLHKPVDAIVCACDGVNYLTAREGVQAFFAAAYACLKPGGRLLFDVSSRYKLSTVLGCNTFAEDDEAQAYIWKNCYDPENKLLEMRLTFFAKEGEAYTRFCETHIQRAHSQTELVHALIQAGFTADAYAAFTTDAPKADTERIQFAAVKPV